MTLKDWIAEDAERTQQKVADGIGVDQAFVSRLCNGAACSADVMKRIFDFTGGSVTPNDMVLGRAA
jgi:plasmid maintenance system antidote protein VapI